MERNSIAVALDLLSLGSGENAAGSTEKAKERLLTASILQSKTSLWRYKVYVQDHGWQSTMIFFFLIIFILEFGLHTSLYLLRSFQTCILSYQKQRAALKIVHGHFLSWQSLSSDRPMLSSKTAAQSGPAVSSTPCRLHIYKFKLYYYHTIYMG